MILALNVLAAAGLGLTWKFVPAGQAPAEEDKFSAEYRDTFAPLVTNIVLMILTPKWLYDNGPDYPGLLSFLPEFLRKHVLGAKKFKGLMRQLVDERTTQIESGRVSDNIFLNAIIAKSRELKLETKTKTESSSSGGGLSEDELFANIVDYNLAGHETTAHTLNYCFHVLAVEPQYQAWVQEELDHVFLAGDLPLDPDTLGYAETFHRLKRCLALMVGSIPLTHHSQFPSASKADC